MKNKSDTSINEKAIRIDKKLTAKKDSSCQQEQGGDNQLDTPDIIASNNTEWPQQSKGQSAAEDYHSAGGQVPDHAMYDKKNK